MTGRKEGRWERRREDVRREKKEKNIVRENNCVRREKRKTKMKMKGGSEEN